MSELSFSPQLLGHESAMGQIAAALATGRMHHAWLITGIEGIGKTTLAHHIAASVLSGGENEIGKINPTHRVTKLIAAEAHPDMLVIRRGIDEKTGEPRKGISVEDMRSIADFTHKTATHGGWRVVIIDEAHLLNRNAQNAVLKILEEPPSRVLILITVTTVGALLPTILSRCRVLPLAPLDDKSMKVILARNAPEATEAYITRLIALAGGSVGLALKILRTETLPLFDELMAIMAGFPALDIPRLHKIGERISPKAEGESYDVLITLLTNHLAQAARNDAVTQGVSQSLEHRVQLWEKTRATFAAAEHSNLDKKLAFINAIHDIRAMTA